jgi:hypothetical protein
LQPQWRESYEKRLFGTNSGRPWLASRTESLIENFRGALGQDDGLAYQVQNLDVVLQNLLRFGPDVFVDFGTPRQDIIADYPQNILKPGTIGIGVRDKEMGHF